MPVPFVPRIDLRNAATCWDFFRSHAPVTIIVGPLGSGKSVTCCAKIMARALMQEPSPRDNVRYFKAAIVRNTLPELKRTTIETWKSIFPEEKVGRIKMSPPVQQHIRVPPRAARQGREAEPGLDLLIDYFGLDRPDHVKQLLSYEGTLIWFNECREIPKAIIDAADLRIGRYPSREFQGVDPTWYGIIGDSNAPGPRNWLYHTVKGTDEFGNYIGRPENWEIFIQPPAVIEMEPDGQSGWRNKSGEVEYYTDNERYVMRSAGSLWATNPAAENLANLQVHPSIDPTKDPLGPGGYYQRGLANKNRDWIQSYYQVKFGYVRTGKPVIPEFDVETHVTDDLPILENELAQGGLDIGGGTFQPAAVIGQFHPRGVWMAHYEVIGKDIGGVRFIEQLKTAHAQVMGQRKFSALYGDPAGRKRDELFETSMFDALLAADLPAMPAPSNDIKTRVDAIRAPCTRLIPNPPERPMPGLLVHRRCTVLIEGLSGGWNYKQMQVPGEQRYADKPDKNEYSHPCDAAGYWLSGGGETTGLQTGTTPESPSSSEPMQAVVDFDVFGT